jgi:hypothetical protein
MELMICFIDDSDFEHMLVREEIAPNAPNIRFVQAYTFEEAKDLLGNKLPLLFLLDLWGQDEAISSPYITPRHELEEMVSRLNTLDSVYAGLEGFQGNPYNEYLKRVFRIVDAWRDLFEEVCARVGQNRKYGLNNLNQVRTHYPGIPAVFYTRKSLINDALALFKANADGLFKKPTGQDDMETRTLTKKYAPRLIQDLLTIIQSKMDHLKTFDTFYREGLGLDVHTHISTWKEFINK